MLHVLVLVVKLLAGLAAAALHGANGLLDVQSTLIGASAEDVAAAAAGLGTVILSLLKAAGRQVRLQDAVDASGSSMSGKEDPAAAAAAFKWGTAIVASITALSANSTAGGAACWLQVWSSAFCEAWKRCRKNALVTLGAEGGCSSCGPCPACNIAADRINI
jgi:hypothetical protein